MKDNELKAIFLAEALTNQEELNRLFTQLEKNHQDQQAIGAIFRITHTLKANAAAMGYDAISDISHILEDIFSIMKSNKVTVGDQVFNDLFRANDKLGALIDSIKTEKRVSHRGLMTRLKVILRDLSEQQTNESSEAPSGDESTPDVDADQATTLAEEEAQILEIEEEDIGTSKVSFSDFVQVPIEKLDQLLNLVSELAIERDRMITAQLKINGSRSSNEFAGLYRISADLQYAVMSVRLVKVNVLFNKFHRIVRDVANFESKKVDLVLAGTDIEIDRNVLQTISESMIHLVRNGISHGLETEVERAESGKTAIGTLKLSARNDKDAIAIEVRDDGKGIDPEMIKRKALEKGMATLEQLEATPDRELLQYIFKAGFSSKEQVTEVSGRGVGMDVVKRSIESIGGNIRIDTELGKGTTFTLLLPASMAVKKVLLFEVGASTFAIPLLYIESVIQMHKEEVRKMAKGLIGTFSGSTLSLIFLSDLFNKGGVSAEEHSFHKSYDQLAPNSQFHVVLITLDGKTIGLVVDRLIQQKEIIEKPLQQPIGQTQFINGASILGDGSICLILDIPAIVRQLFNH